MPKIKVLDTGYESFDYEKKLFENHGYTFEIWPGDKGDVAGKKAFAADAEGLLIRWTLIDDEFLVGLSNLKAIVRYGVGYENIDIEAVNRAGVKAAIVQGYGNHAVSDHALALMYALNRRLPDGQSKIRDIFGAPPVKNIFDFHESTLGIIGLGRIGGTLCRKTVHLFKRVIACDPYIDASRFDELGASAVTLEALMRQSHVVSIHCNLTPETTGLLNEHAFAQAEKQPILINTARGPVIHQQALLKALKNGQISMAGLDVFETELPSELPEALLANPRILCTGHYAWYSLRSHQLLQQRAADNLLALLQGKDIDDCLNP